MYLDAHLLLDYRVLRHFGRENVEATICSFLVDASLEQMCRGSKQATSRSQLIVI